MATTPVHAPPSTMRLVTKYSSNRWMRSYFIDVWKSVWRMWKPTLSAAYTVRFTDMPPNALRRLEERVEDVEADLVRGIHGPLHGHASERALAHAAVLVAGPRATPVLEADDFLRAPGHEELDRVLVGEEVGSLDRVEGVEFEGVVIA